MDRDTEINIDTKISKLDIRVEGDVFSSKLSTRIAFRLLQCFPTKIAAIKVSLLVLEASERMPAMDSRIQ